MSTSKFPTLETKPSEQGAADESVSGGPARREETVHLKGSGVGGRYSYTIVGKKRTSPIHTSIKGLQVTYQCYFDNDYPNLQHHYSLDLDGVIYGRHRGALRRVLRHVGVPSTALNHNLRFLFDHLCSLPTDTSHETLTAFVDLDTLHGNVGLQPPPTRNYVNNQIILGPDDDGGDGEGDDEEEEADYDRYVEADDELDRVLEMPPKLPPANFFVDDRWAFGPPKDLPGGYLIPSTLARRDAIEAAHKVATALGYDPL